MNKLLLFLIFPFIFNCTAQENKKEETVKIKVLNFGTFHFGNTPDANKVEYNEKGEKEHKEIRELSKILAKFKPTIICVETPPKFNNKLNEKYQEFLKNPSKLITDYGEVSMVAFDVARLSGVEKIYGIDHQLGYNYKIAEMIDNKIDPLTYKKFKANPFADSPEFAKRYKDFDNVNLKEKLSITNNQKYLDFLINTNADILMYAGTKDNFEGADQCGLFYLRNMRMYSNLNRIPMTKDDRVFIIMGAAHTAFFKEFIKRSPKFEMVNTFDYLK